MTQEEEALAELNELFDFVPERVAQPVRRYEEFEWLSPGRISRNKYGKLEMEVNPSRAVLESVLINSEKYYLVSKTDEVFNEDMNIVELYNLRPIDSHNFSILRSTIGDWTKFESFCSSDPCTFRRFEEKWLTCELMHNQPQYDEFNNFVEKFRHWIELFEAWKAIEVLTPKPTSRTVRKTHKI
jgi:hypothetical protein